MKIDELTEQIIGCAYRVHNELRTGFLEKVYENALRIEMELSGLSVKQQVPIAVYYRDQIIGDYAADLLVNECVIVELKAVRAILPEFEVQLVNYLTATKIDDGLLINFGPSVEIRRKYREYKSKK